MNGRVHSVLAVFSSKEPPPTTLRDGRGINISGVDFWHAVEFSRNGRFLCTHPRGLSSGLPFGVSNLTRPFSVPFPARNSLRWPVGGPCLFGSLAAPFW